MRETTKEVLVALENLKGKDNVLYGKGGFWIRGEGWISLAKARRITGIKAPKREPRPIFINPDYYALACFATVGIKKAR
jgi:hypothetical protein